MKLEDLSPEVLEKAETCETVEELMNLAEAEGIELSEEDLNAITGGAGNPRVRMPLPRKVIEALHEARRAKSQSQSQNPADPAR